MSFILDALKKSESERQRQSGPALFEVKIAPPRSRFAVWGVAIGALLAINFIVVGFVLWRGSASRAANSASATAVSSGAVIATRAPASAAAPVAAGTHVPATATNAATAGTAATPATGATTATGTPTPAGAPAQTTAVPLNANAAGTASAGAAGAGTGSAGTNPDDLPAVEPRGSTSQPVTGVVRATESGLPTYQEAAAEPGANIPDLKLDLHVYSEQPDQRFVFLEADTHMLKLREGDTTPQGVRVEHITQNGAILSYRGKEFVLPHQ